MEQKTDKELADIVIAARSTLIAAIKEARKAGLSVTVETESHYTDIPSITISRPLAV